MSSAVLRRNQIAPEAVVGTAVAPTRQLGGALTMKPADQRRLRESMRASMFGPTVWEDMAYMSTGTYTGRYVHNEAPFFLASSMRGNVAPSGALWTYAQRGVIDPLKSMTVYCGTNTKALRAAGVFTSRLEIAGADTDWWRINAALLGRRLVGDQTGATYDFNNALTTGLGEGAKNKKNIWYIDDAGGTIGTTLKANSGYRFRWVFDAKIAPDFAWATGGLDMSDIQRDIPEITLEITTKWDAAAVAQYQKYMGTSVALPERPDVQLIRLENSGAETSPGANFRTQIDGAYVATDFEPLGEDRDGTQLGRMTFTAVEDATFGKCTVSVRNQLTAADLPVV